MSMRLYSLAAISTIVMLLSANLHSQDSDIRIEFNKQPAEKIEFEHTRPEHQDIFAKLRRGEGNFTYDTGSVGVGSTSITPLLPGSDAPEFSLAGLTGNTVNIVPQQIKKPLVVTFYRGGWCPYCNLHLAELRKAEEALIEQGFDVWFISPDRPELLYESLQEPDIGYTLYSDSTLSAAKAFGVAYEVEQSELDQFFNGGLTLKEATGEQGNLLPVPGTFLIGTDGLIHFQYVNPNFKTRLDPNVLLAAAESYVKYAKSARLANN